MGGGGVAALACVAKEHDEADPPGATPFASFAGEGTSFSGSSTVSNFKGFVKTTPWCVKILEILMSSKVD